LVDVLLLEMTSVKPEMERFVRGEIIV